MRIFLLFFLLGSLVSRAQSGYDNFGPMGAEVYSDLKTAIKIGSGVYKLDLSYQTIDPKLWAKLGKLKDLQVLHLSANTGVTELPESMNELKNLVYFCSVGNPFTRLPDLKNFPSLMYMELLGMKIDSIPNDFAYLQRLKTFKFSATDDTLRITKNLKFMKGLNTVIFESVILDSCPRPLFRLENLKVLSLKNCRVQALPENLDRASNLESLNLDNNKLTALPRGIYALQNLTVLSLRNNRIRKIPDTIGHLQNLTHLDLRGNEISKENLEEIQALLEGCEIIY